MLGIHDKTCTTMHVKGFVMSDVLLLTVEGAARRLGMSRGALYPRVMSGEIPSIKIGKSRRIPIAQLEAWVALQVREQLSDSPA
jgi:excisionase family DNA binding protein